MDGEYTSMMLSASFSWLVAVGLDAALVIIAATVVRHHRPDVASWVLAPAIAGLVWTVVASALQVLVPYLGWQGEGVEQMMRANAVLGVVRTVISGCIKGALCYGIYRLARPPFVAAGPRGG